MVTKAAEVRVDPRVTRTQKLISDALRALLEEKSFESISVQDIAERATVNRATFYAHYTDKFALLDAIVRDDVSAALSEGDPLAIADAREMLRLLAARLFGFVQLYCKSRIDKEFEPQFERAIEGELCTLLLVRFPECAAFLISSAIVGVAMRWRATGGKEPIESVSGHVVDILVDGVAKLAH